MEVLLDTELERDPEAVPLSRRAIAPITEYLSPHQQMTMDLLTTEVVANEVRHGESSAPISLRVEDHGGFLRVEVEADSPGFAPVPQEPSMTAESGRGFLLLDRLSDRFGVRKQGHLTTAWFDVICARP